MAKWTKETAPLGARGAVSKPGGKPKAAKPSGSGSTVVHVHHHYHGAAPAARKTASPKPKDGI